MKNSIKHHFRPLLAREKHESNRSATELELFFDLITVIAIAAAAHGLRHQMGHGHVVDGIVQFAMAFFMVWWPWNQFSWFASSFDNDDVSYRLAVFVMMLGTLVIAAAIPGFFEEQFLECIFVGYIILRLAFAFLVWRAGRNNPGYKRTAQRQVWSLVLLQIFWGCAVINTSTGSTAFFTLFAIGILAELLWPWFSENAKGAESSSFHRHHISERFGLLTIIVLGEVLLGSSESFKNAFANQLDSSLIFLGLFAFVIAVSMWWLYFTTEDHLQSDDIGRVFMWGYGHLLIFASAAAVGAGIGLAVDVFVADSAEHPLHINKSSAAHAISIPAAVFVFGLWLVRDRFHLHAPHSWILLVFAGLIGVSGFLPFAPASTALFLCLCLGFRLNSKHNSQNETVEST